MKIKSIGELKKKWNEQADEYNQWDTLGLDEIILLAQSDIIDECAKICENSIPRDSANYIIAKGFAEQIRELLMSECIMQMIETGDLNIEWECSVCKLTSKGTKKFEKSKFCPSCGSQIKEWVSLYDT